MKLIGRKDEQNILLEALNSEESELVSVIGRRRVGKTFLVRQVYKHRICFELAGVQDASREEQLLNFNLKLNKTAQSEIPFSKVNTWLEAFYQLMSYLERLEHSEKKVVFFDELPWLSTRRSGFLNAFDVFWNSWASVNNVVVVICGSAASWMIQKVVNNKGGLHNRITKRLHLKPFNLGEAEEFLKARNIVLDRYQIVQLYMAIGGIPYYLKEIKLGQSYAQSIEQICFSENGLLKNEFTRLYEALFEHADQHIRVIRALASKHIGIKRAELLKLIDANSGGSMSRTLEELEQSGFISSYYTFQKRKKEKLYRLTDEYSLFYLQFIEQEKQEGGEIWKQLSQTQFYKSWSGYAYESICLKHISQIKKALGISGVYSTSSAFYKTGTSTEKGVQIDLVIDRNDHVINLCEAKFYNAPFSLDKSYAMRLREKMATFQETTKTSKQLFWTLITTFGLKQNEHSIGLIQQVLTLDDLFEV